MTAVSRHASQSEALAALGRETPGERLSMLDVDLVDEASIDALPAQLREWHPRLHLVINAAGVLHADNLRPERSIHQLTRSSLDQAFALNAFAPILLARALMPLLDRDERSVFASLSARVGSISDNRLGGWCAYPCEQGSAEPADPHIRDRTGAAQSESVLPAAASRHGRHALVRTVPGERASGKTVQRRARQSAVAGHHRWLHAGRQRQVHRLEWQQHSLVSARSNGQGSWTRDFRCASTARLIARIDPISPRATPNTPPPAHEPHPNFT